MKLLIIGHARHGKDTLAQMIHDLTGMTYKGSSEMAAEIFIYDALKDKYGYSSFRECFEDRVNHRKEWHDLICDYNKDDKARLAKEIMKRANIYVGMRSSAEIRECLTQGVFDYVIGVYDPRKPHESKDSFSIDLFTDADFIIPNGGALEELEAKAAQIVGDLVVLNLLRESLHVTKHNSRIGV